MNEREEDLISIDFKALFRILWSNKWLIVAITTLFTFGGAWYAFTAREEFVSQGKILPEISGSGGSSLGGIASLIGMGGFELGLKNSTEAIRPDLYPDILSSTPFFMDLFKNKFINKNGDSIQFNNYYLKSIENQKEVDPKILTTFKAKPAGVIIMNRLTEIRIKDLKERISGSIDKKSGVLSINVKMPDPVIAAQIAEFAMNYLTTYVTDYRTEKNKRDVDFLGRKVAAARGEFYKDQANKAVYADQFSAPTIRLQAADVQRERLESDYRMSTSVYNELLKKYEEAKIKLQQETPVFQVLEPPVVPNLKSEPKRMVIVITATILGFIISIITFLLYKKNYKKIII